MTAASESPDASDAESRRLPAQALSPTHDLDDDPYGWVGYESAQPHAWAADDTGADDAAKPRACPR